MAWNTLTDVSASATITSDRENKHIDNEEYLKENKLQSVAANQKIGYFLGTQTGTATKTVTAADLGLSFIVSAVVCYGDSLGPYFANGEISGGTGYLVNTWSDTGVKVSGGNFTIIAIGT